LILIKKYFDWLFRKPVLTWLLISLLVIPLIFLKNPFYNEVCLVWLGVIYQSIGIVSVVINIYRTRKQFKDERLTKKIISWWHSRPKAIGSTQYISPDGYNVSITPLDITLTTVPKRDKSKSSDENIERLFKMISEQTNQIEALSKEFERKITETHNLLFLEIKDSKRSTNKLQLDLKSSALDGLELSFVGSFCILIGVIISTIPSLLITIIR
jgi:hypothetical protein